MSDTQAPKPEAPSSGPRYETRDLPLVGVVGFCVALVIVTLLVMVLMRRTLSSVSTRLARAQVVAPLAAERPPATPPPLPADHLMALRAEEDRILNSFGWIDRQAGIARIPIARALDLLAEQGLPMGPAAESGSNHDEAPSLPSQP